MNKAFTLIETMVAISLLMVAIVAPMSLTIQSLASAYYARDQITASNLAQEGIESVRSVRDGNILQIAEGVSPPPDLFGSIPQNQWFTIDTRTNAISNCGSTAASCPALETDGTFYGYNPDWTATGFTRSLYAAYVTGTTDELRLEVIVSWKTGSFQARSITLYENLYRWVANGSGMT